MLPATPAQAEPTLTQGQTARVLGRLRADPEMRALLKGQPPEVLLMGPWLDETHELIGASLVLKLPEPRSFPMRHWPVVKWNPNKARETSYAEDSLEARATDATELMVRVDIGKDRVVSVEPSGEHVKVEPGPSVKAEDPSGRHGYFGLRGGSERWRASSRRPPSPRS